MQPNAEAFDSHCNAWGRSSGDKRVQSDDFKATLRSVAAQSATAGFSISSRSAVLWGGGSGG